MAIPTALEAPRSTFVIASTLLLFFTTTAFGLDISYCSPQNNAGSFQAVYNQYQSNGACQVTCQGSYAFAVLQGSYCWCSNYIPEEQQDTNDCDEICPGFGEEWCGNTDASLYGYYLLSPGVPRGTLGSSGTPTTSGSSVSTSPITSGSPGSAPAMETSPTVEYSQTSEETSPAPSEVASSSSSSSTSTETSPSITPSPTPSEVYTSIITVTGEASSVRTVLVTPPPAATQDATLGQSSTGGGEGVNTGKIVGIVLGTALGLALLVGIGLWFWFKRRHRRSREDASPEMSYAHRPGGSPSNSNNVPSRQVSQLSSSTLLTHKTKVPQITTNVVLPGGDSRNGDTPTSGFDRRSVATDQRLNPYALYLHDESRGSNVSLQDNQDYSRQLRVANPDP